MVQFKPLISIIVIVLEVILSGCTGSQDATPVFKALPEVQQFMKEHPNAKITVTYWSKDEVAKSIQEINQQCDKSITPVAMYKETISEGDLKIVAWINAENQIVICSVTQGSQTTTSTLTATVTSTSAPAENETERNIVLLIDSSGSTAQAYSQAGYTVPAILEIDAIAKNFVNKVSPHTNLGIVAFGGTTTVAYPLVLMTGANKQATMDKIVFEPQGGELGTDIDIGLDKASQVLSSVSGTKDVYVISDGQIETCACDANILKIGNEMIKQGIKLHFIQVEVNFQGGTALNIDSNYQKMATALNAELIPVPIGGRPSISAVI